MFTISVFQVIGFTLAAIITLQAVYNIGFYNGRKSKIRMIISDHLEFHDLPKK